ncbi:MULTISPECIES: S1 family peptidase [Streptomyces]|uniref:S1 family peptidase n=1 Tax=Streptomyces tsukubensis (strain DSM 42081 / NBRC 108919 / NRRL 18488 / 9993) TaxID=1114943 RepID=A0A7G3USE5_STRT9|nr:MULTISPECIES: S1 family peptidase [Streptomyces]MYS62743.1 trypsin-like serine protease [Streptomyces sp. SID5473]QKM71342.1 S1 family peptidase [Streptomyces tsukubensis NRRL18488]TAI45564.1 S1 family peptidase [Streptomyces tsukubensis]
MSPLVKRPVGRRGSAAVIAGLATIAALVAPTAVAAEAPAGKASAAQLATASKAVLTADVAGTAWYTDKASGKIVVTADSTVSQAAIAKIKKTAGSQAGNLVVKRTPGKISRLIAGGEAITSAGVRCSLGFNVIGPGGYHALTAGHCTVGRPSWSIGTTVTSPNQQVFPVYDHGVIRHSNPAAADGRVYLYNGTYRDIINSGYPSVGTRIERSGSTTGYRTGSVTALNVTVNYGGGQLVYNTIQTNACAQPGDSGGPLFTGNTALGLLSGGSGNCSIGGTTFYEPVQRPLSLYGYSVF